MTDTHSYDGKWIERLAKLRELNLPESSTFNAPPVQARVNQMLTDETVDPSNGVTPGQLTRMLAARMQSLKNTLSPSEYEETSRIVFEQFADIDNGPCIQGRTTRVFQILAALVGV
jgi:hypothetical protein